ncbi:hypothetical protein ACQVPR_28790 [Bacillus cereus]
MNDTMTYRHLDPNMNIEVANKFKNVITVRKNGTNKRKLISNQYIKRK